MRITLFPDITLVLDNFPELPEATRPITDRFIYGREQGSANFPETDVWIFKTRRLNTEILTWKTQFRRLFHLFRRLF